MGPLPSDKLIKEVANMSQKNLQFESRTMWVVILTTLTMIVEIIYGILTNSMALLADGIQMGSHVLAIGLSWLAYVVVRRVSSNEKFSGNSKKVLSLSDYIKGLSISSHTCELDYFKN